MPKLAVKKEKYGHVSYLLLTGNEIAQIVSQTISMVFGNLPDEIVQLPEEQKATATV